MPNLRQFSISILRYKISDWFRLFAKQRDTKLSRENEIGLFGELKCLEEFLLDSTDYFNAINVWTGPFSELHDFTSNQFSIEVKSTLQQPQMSINISNPLQLDESRVLNLFLMIQQLEINSHGHTLPALIENIKSKIGNVNDAARKFDECLEAYGYNDQYSSEYNDKFLKKETAFYKVNKNFPKIRYSDLDLGVHDVKYKISTHAIEIFKITHEIVEREIKSI